MAEIRLEHVSKTYVSGVRGVEDLSLTAADGQLVVLVGPSGCGKTTTLRLIAGLDTPTTGIIRIKGRVVNGVPPRQRDVAMVFQRPTLYPHLTVAANLAFGVQMRQGSGAWRRGLWRLFRPGRYAAAARQQQELDGRLAEAARVLGLTEMLGRRPAQLSGGEQQRVALGRALVRRPAAFLLDEPLSNLDPSLRHELRRQLHLLQRRLRATMIHVTHDQVEAMTLGDQVVVLDGGKVQQAGPPGTLYAQPANRFVAGFIGWPPMNFLEGALQRNDAGNVVFAAGDCCLPLPRERGLQSALRPDTMVTAGIRPEYVRLAGAVAKTKQGPRLSMEVLLIESLGSSSLVTLEHGSWQLLAQVERQLPVRERQTVEVLVDMDKIHWFDRINGQALSSIPAG